MPTLCHWLITYFSNPITFGSYHVLLSITRACSISPSLVLFSITRSYYNSPSHVLLSITRTCSIFSSHKLQIICGVLLFWYNIALLRAISSYAFSHHLRSTVFYVFISSPDYIAIYLFQCSVLTNNFLFHATPIN